MTTGRADWIRAKAEAKAAGLKTYVGKDCAKHGSQPRWVSNGSCVICNQEGIKPYRKRHAERLLEKRRDWDESNPIKAMLQRARARARRLGLEFDLAPEDIHIPERCPVLGITLERKCREQDSSPSLDRIENDKGYVKGNVIVVSFRANRIKGNASVAELRKVLEFYEQI